MLASLGNPTSFSVYLRNRAIMPELNIQGMKRAEKHSENLDVNLGKNACKGSSVVKQNISGLLHHHVGQW